VGDIHDRKVQKLGKLGREGHQLVGIQVEMAQGPDVTHLIGD
jgi:hypothetical protein